MPDHDGPRSNPYRPDSQMACPCIFGDTERCWCKPRTISVGGTTYRITEQCPRDMPHFIDEADFPVQFYPTMEMPHAQVSGS